MNDFDFYDRRKLSSIVDCPQFLYCSSVVQLSTILCDILMLQL